VESAALVRLRFRGAIKAYPLLMKFCQIARIGAASLLLLLCTSLSTSAQSNSKITGTVVDSSTKKPLPYSSISILKADSFYLGTAADANGKFELSPAPGKYTIEVSVMGFVKKRLPLQVERSANKPLTISLTPEAGALKEVTITQLKALVEDKGDRLVYNAEKDISNAGGTAADVLRKVPMLTVDVNGNVQMRGSGNIRVLVNGKPSSMMARNLADALRQMPANVIKAVEVITSPGAKYDAEGSAGVINIITKKGLQGFNGSVNATAGNLNRSVGGNLSYRKKKIGIALSLSTYQYRNQHNGESSRTAFQDGVPINVIDQQTSGDNTGTGANGELSVDYDPDSLSRINFSANIWGGAFPSNSLQTTTVHDADGSLLQAYSNESWFRNPFGNGQLDLGYTKTFKKPGQEFSLLTQFSRMPDNYFYRTLFFTPDEDLYLTQYSDNFSRNKEYTAQTDYVHPFTKIGKRDTLDIKIETGIKFIYRDIGSEFVANHKDDINGPLIPDPEQSNVFDYTQKVMSAYTSLRMDTKKKWSVVLGARLERTELRGNFTSSGTSVNNTFNNLIPSINISKGIKKHRVKFSYTQRIQRPMIWLLNPWLNARDPKNIWTGNPFLLPELNHSWEIGHSISGENGFSLNSSFYYRHTNKGFEFLAKVDSDGVSLVKPLNVGKRFDLGLNINTTTQPLPNWNLGGGGELTYVDMKTTNSTLKASGWTWRLNYNTSYKFPKDYTIQADGSVGSGWINLQRKNSGWYWYSFSGKKELWKKKASLTLGVNNPFNARVKITAVRTDPSFLEYSNFSFINRGVRLTFEWRFGEMVAGGKQTKKISNDDKGGR
jgi:outer membrane receptor protein involved in Fe transport